MRIGRGSMGRLAIAAMLAGVGIAHPAAAQKTLLILGESVPASLDYDGPAGNHPASQTGFHNLIEPMVEYALGGKTARTARSCSTSTSSTGALAESWSFDRRPNLDLQAAPGREELRRQHVHRRRRALHLCAREIASPARRRSDISSRPSHRSQTSRPALFAKTPEATSAASSATR